MPRNTGSTNPAVNDLDIPKRMSFVSGTSQGKDLEEGSYTGVKTPDGAPGGEFEGGALRPGGMPVLISKENLGLLVEYAIVGLVYGLLPETIYPFMQQYLNCSGSQVAAAKQLVTLPWSFKVFYGILSDCRPICGYRRRPYMLIGWGICLIMLLVMCIMPIGKPYYTVASDRNVAVADYTPEIEARINYNASSEGAKYVIIMCCAAIGYVMSDVCADSITVELAQREPLDKRGKTQSMIYTVRTAMVIFGEILVGFFFNGEDYGGDFDFSLSFPQLMIVVTVLMLPVFPMTWFFIKEEKKEAANFRQYISAFWDLLCTRAVYQVIAYNFFSNIFSTMTYTASSPVASYMVGVTPLNTTLSDILSNLLFMSGIMITSKWGLHWNWRWMIVGTAATLIVVDCVCEMIVIWDIFRNQWFWLGPPIVVQLPYGVGWIISTYVTVELAGLGNEGAVYGLITTVTNTAQPFATSLSLLVDGPFNITNERVQLDDHSIRMDITYTIIIMYCAMMFAWVFLFLLPKQKEDTQRLLREGGKSRLIVASSTSKSKQVEEGGYVGVKTPDGSAPVNEFEGGALRPGGMPDLMHKDNIGLLFQYAIVGLVYGLLPATIYPFLQNYLNSSGSQVAAAKQLVVLPWSFKVFYGILSDCRPLFGYRRRPYMLIGWSICILMTLIMAIMPIGKPYYTNPDDRDINTADYTPEIEARINYDAPSEGAKYVIIMFFAAVGYVLSDVCADSITVELAQREPIDKRGKTQSAIYAVRTALMIFGQLLTGFFFNGEEYGGDFDFSLSFPQLMIIVTVLSLPVLPMTWWYIKEEKAEPANFRLYMNEFWKLLCTRAVYQVIAYNFFATIFSSMTYTASSPVASIMVGVTPINSTISDILSNSLFMSGIMITSKWGLHWNWRWMILGTAAVVIVVDFTVSLIVVWDIFRNQWFWLGPPIAVQLPYGVGWIISTYVTVELAGLGNEAAVYGLITTVANVAQPFATSLTLLIDGPFDITNERVKVDDHSVRMDITYTIIIMYVCMAFSWVFLPLLPRQREETQQLLREGGISTRIGAITVFYLAFAIVWSVMTNIMAIFDSTSCLIIAGGTGC
ncbi:hypothetical protein BBO99_00008211 [Phytophthora kernoviae]|uniref:Folate-Biopterin Transporter (FBT) Family n=2 Tax=Phytophthora kernoviae TaxID=325452 RepID=A0A3R7GUE6_9STRA|nr:hypothetical protein G195_009447 [Phytophthora kernoviae 00238/432]KAG2517170.1 hypothetical protein JM18_007884 [Phytophthora kernoviae]KAG2518509.1 hypothetical protein JM16_007330 [Phytophthora kernoviae]RLN20727.1 hypothetical protein BBI17_008155 [Phytophthora kernoviae]RLN75595.1 hypothetical protein BBO99_00008211 [Phytophthora kernoviae]